MSVREKISSKYGMTLLEVMIATVIMGVIIVSSVSFFIYAARLRMEARARQAAIIHANSLMERTFQASTKVLYDQGERDLDPDDWPTAPSSDCTWSFSGIDPDSLFDIHFTPQGSDLALITVRVQFKSGTFGSPGSTVSLDAYRYCED